MNEVNLFENHAKSHEFRHDGLSKYLLAKLYAMNMGRFFNPCNILSDIPDRLFLNKGLILYPDALCFHINPPILLGQYP